MLKHNVLFGLGLLVLTLSMAGLAGCRGSESKAVAATPRQELVADNRTTDLVGERGPVGLTGPAGEQGPTGLAGSPGGALVGPRGAEGPAGNAGMQGSTGARGPAGDVVAGGPGLTGPTGPAGIRGTTGETGVQGASAEGYAGPTGSAGPAGPRGETGETGAKGPTLVGPSGPAGAVGSAGVQGATGEKGGQGGTTAGTAGPTGPTGAAGVRGATGETGAAGVAGVVPCWVAYRTFVFDTGKSNVREIDANMVADIAAYAKKTPSLDLAIDYNGVLDTRATDLTSRRAIAVRDALTQAGVSANRIKIGPFGAAESRRSDRTEVLLRTAAN